ncbi:ribonuclease Y [Xiamenia xianingshaonis]|uniref:Ribonuclease Y n=1 Tax=Xiamenia xianingshaonis TaxID=2682776 RepID=A0A9E6SV27_9ACTN|nr:ribonuclease Y [Xiamenia xianingshaonis]NGM17069.1 ribonuclease Y [Eggerthellaceae bacterium zg-893]NHM13753.1 ribonuclease Y [Xiamenia xianingshaonis]NHM16963.1 ribonuclease Y [Xiamenia xianingshaonis]QTU85120.1 ribonuclease Y [Xiamenia xianingshaonis]
MPSIVWLIIGLVAGAALGYVIVRYVANASTKKASEEASAMVEDAKRQAETMRREAAIEAKDQALKLKQEMEAENKERLKEVRSAENRLTQREESLDRRVESLDNRERQISSLQGQLEKRERDIVATEAEVGRRLEQVAGMTPEEAKHELLDTIKDEVTHESAAIIREAETRAKAEADKKARSILSLAIQRVAADHTAETTVSTIHIPSDDLKGRIIGREGRNIRSFESLTGTNLIIDDTPECVSISCFDPVRREIGRVTMENLVADGRIHPARIEEMFGKAEAFVNQRVQEAGEQATFDTGIHDLHPEIVTTLGRLRYRTSYGQNVLNHSLEVAYLCGVMASELGLDPVPAKRAGLLHDLGKAVDHEVEGSHAIIGADLARRFGEKADIVHAIEAHHNDVEPSSVLAVLVQAADAISAARPGARKETLDAYIKRLEKLEEIANSYAGVDRTYAIQAGREVRVMVHPDKVDEAATTVLAHDIAQRIENEMQYPGQVKVVVIRESRAVSIAK